MKQDLVTCWDGVKNYQAINNMKKMKLGEQAFFYHSGKEKQIMGIVEIVREYYQEDSVVFGMVDVKYIEELPSPVSLKEIKVNLPGMQTLKQPRLSVSQVSKIEWDFIKTFSL
ncbi:ubiquinol-cytochrome c reductase [Rickettsiales bacterium]|nr:ubiquinol-cytochrome c reductase [Rickettsiales bacterium]